MPSTSSGIGDLPGGDVLVTLGSWGNGFVGSEFVQASTTMHELGHDFGLTHAGAPQVPAEPNCKPNYLSVMNYLFQVRGLADDAGELHIDYSREGLGALDEAGLVETNGLGVMSAPLYRTAWYAPLVPGTIGYVLGTPAATRFCNGARLPDPLPGGWVDMVRIDGTSTTGAIDWNADGDDLDAVAQDINFDGLSTPLKDRVERLGQHSPEPARQPAKHGGLFPRHRLRRRDRLWRRDRLRRWQRSRQRHRFRRGYRLRWRYRLRRRD